MIKNYIITFVAALLACAGASAQIKVEAPGVVALNEQFSVSFVLTDKPSDFEWTPNENFQLVWGPQTGSSTSISIINGKTTRNSQYTYTYVLLPRNAGTFALGPAHAKVGGNDIYSRSANVEVVGESSSSGGASSGASGAGASGAGAAVQNQDNFSEDIFMRFSLSRTSAVVGEPITATLKLYTSGGISGFEDAKFPTFNGFWAQEVEAPQSIEFRRENVGGKIYNTAVLRKWVIIPQKPGSINIDPAELVCLVQQRISSGNSIFDGFFDDYQTIRKRVISKAYTVNVKSLPAGAPASFTGAVGKYRISAVLDTDSLKVHDAASLTVTVSGSGNVALVGAPKVKFPPDSEVYDTKTTDRIEKGSGGVSGSKVFEYPFIPRSYGDFVLEPIEFTYYDVSGGRYVTVTTSPIPYHVEKGDESNYVPGEGISVPAARRGDAVRNLGEDIHYISTRVPALRSESNFFVGTGLFVALCILMIIAAAALYFVISRLRSARADVALVRTKSASKVAKKRLSAAGGYLAKNLYSAFYEELHRALLGYASDKLNLGGADLSKESISRAFIAAGANEATVDQYTALLDKCEFARYAPDSSNDAMAESYDTAMTVISTLDDNMKKVSSRIGGRAAAGMIAFLMFAGNALSANAQQNMQYVDSLWNAAVNAYSQGDWNAAAASFSSIEKLGLTGAQLYTNIADSYYKGGSLAMAVLYYERALKTDPSFKDARYNLEIAGAGLQDRIETVPEFFLKTFSRNVCYRLSSNAWAVLFLCLLAITLAALLVFFLSRRSTPRKTGFFGAIVALLLSIPCLVNALWQKNEFENKDAAIVMCPVCSAKSTPSASSGADLFVLHEGTKVKILDSVGDWYNISIADGREGWIESRNITVI